MTSKYVDKQEQQKNQELFEYWQAEYNRTHDVSILWEHLEPLFRLAAGPNILKLNKYHFVKNFDEKVDSAVLNIMERYKKKPDYNFRSLVTLMFWAAKYVCHNEKVVAEETVSHFSYEELIEKGMHEEHVLSTEFGDISTALRSIDSNKGDEYEQGRTSDDGSQTRVCNYRAVSHGKGRLFVCTGIRTGETTQGYSAKRKYRIRRKHQVEER